MLKTPLGLLDILLADGRAGGPEEEAGSWWQGQLGAAGDRRAGAGLFGAPRPAVLCLWHLGDFSCALIDFLTTKRTQSMGGSQRTVDSSRSWARRRWCGSSRDLARRRWCGSRG